MLRERRSRAPVVPDSDFYESLPEKQTKDNSRTSSTKQMQERPMKSKIVLIADDSEEGSDSEPISDADELVDSLEADGEEVFHVERLVDKRIFQGVCNIC